MEDFIWKSFFHNQYKVMVQLKAKIKEDVALISTEMVKVALISTKKRVIKLVECQGEAFKGRRVMLELRI